MFGAVQAAVARAVVDSVSSGIIPRDKVDDYCILVGVFIHWEAKNDKKIYDFNYRAVKESIERALKGQPKIDQVISQAKTATHPFAGGADKGWEITWSILDRKSTRLNSSHLGISYA